MTQELNDKLKAQIEQILAEKFPEQGGLDLGKLREKVMTRLRERLPYALIPLAIELILSPVAQGEDSGERLAERFRHVLTALVLAVIAEVGNEELGKFGRSKPCKHWLLGSEFCLKGKEWGSACFNCDDYEPMEEW